MSFSDERIELLKEIADNYSGKEACAIRGACGAIRENNIYRKIGNPSDLYMMKKGHVPFVSLWALTNLFLGDVTALVYECDFDEDDAELLFTIKSDFIATTYLMPKYADADVLEVRIVDNYTIKVHIKEKEEIEEVENETSETDS